MCSMFDDADLEEFEDLEDFEDIFDDVGITAEDLKEWQNASCGLV